MLHAHIATWRAEHAPPREVIFPQMHQPGIAAQSDFTHMADLEVTLGRVPFPHLLYHLVFVYSNVEAVQICASETFEALAEGSSAACGNSGASPSSIARII